MLMRTKKPCAWTPCTELVPSNVRYCPKHERMADQRRGTATDRGYGHRWHVESRAYLREHPYCVECGEQGKRVEASVVDHKQPHRGDPSLFWDHSNWQGLCGPCHNRKTVASDGGFGRPTARG